MNRKLSTIFLLNSCLFLIGVNFLSGEVSISFSELLSVLSGGGKEMHQEVILSLRLPKILTAILAGGSLALCGLLLQTYFQNPLAGPFVLGIHSGSALFVSLWILLGQSLGMKSALSEMGFSSVLASWVGSLAVMGLLLLISKKIPGKVILLVIGLLIGYFSGSLINILVIAADPDSVKSFLSWSMGSFERTTMGNNGVLLLIFLISFMASLIMSRALNLVFVGENFAKSMGVNPKRIKTWIIILSSLLAASVTSFCGPVAFVGMISPHITRLMFQTEDHKILIPQSVLVGSLLALIAITLTHVIDFHLPLNSTFGLLGAPFIVYFLLKKKMGSYA